MELKDYAGAAEAFVRGAQVPNAHPFLKVLAGRWRSTPETGRWRG